MRHALGFVAAILLVPGGTVAPADGPQTITRRYTPADRERDRYVYVPFDVPAGTTELRVSYAYDRASAQNTIDLGIFEPGSLDLHTSVMRGYSGGSKSEITVGACESSPGYRNGPLPEGRWHVMFGLYEVAATGVDVTLTITTRQGPPCPAGGFGRSSGGSGSPFPPRWWSGALHTHTHHSDGAAAPEDVFRRVTDAGLDFVAITDHNNTTHRDALLRRRWNRHAPLWIVGEEVTTPAGHANVWGLAPGGWVDFRVRPRDGRIGELVDVAHRLDALFSINHPAGECGGCSWGHEVPPGVDAIEVWNGRHGAQHRAVARWEGLLRAGRRVTAVGASDWHRDPDPIDNAHVRVLAAGLTQTAILEAIKTGRVVVMRSAGDAMPTFTVRSGARSGTVGDTLTIADGPVSIEVEAPGLTGGRAVVVLNGTRLPPLPLEAAGKARLEPRLAPGYVRLETYDADGAMVAFTNPVYLVGSDPRHGPTQGLESRREGGLTPSLVK